MPGTPAALSSRRGLIAFFAAIAAVALCALMLVPPPAFASTTVKAQLSLSGVATADNPTGGSVLGVHPDDTVVFSAATLPTAGLDKLGIGSLVGGLLGGLAKYQVKVDFSGLPGGKKNTVLSGPSSKSFTFPKVGTYHFTWTAQQVTIGLLGKSILPINLNGNQLAKAGVKLNAKNQYVGSVVVAKNPPKGGISIQLPGVSVQPTLPIVGTLPKVSLPGVTTPTIPTSVPNLNPGSKSKGTKKSTGKAPSTTGGALAIPAMVVPQGSGKVLGNPSSYQGGSTSDGGALEGSSDVSIAPIPGTPAKVVSPAKKAAAAQATVNSAGKNKTIDLASNDPSSSGLPVVLAMIAVLALVLVAGAYARLYLLRKQS